MFALKPDAVDQRFPLIVQALVLGCFPEILLGLDDQDGKVKYPMQRELLRLPGPLFARVPPDLGGDVHLTPIVPLGETQREAFGIGVKCVFSVNVFIVLGDNLKAGRWPAFLLPTCVTGGRLTWEIVAL